MCEHKHAKLLVLLIVAGNLLCAETKAGGALFQACSNLMPKHYASPQESSPPYELKLSKSTYTPGETITVTLSGKTNEKFKGFIVGARRISGDVEDIIGSFIQINLNSRGAYWYGEDIGRIANCITHSSPNDKSSVTFNWKAPSKSVGDVHFTTPVVQSYKVFWSNVTSPVLKAELPNQDPPFTNIVHNELPPDNKRLTGACGTDIGCIVTPVLCAIETCDAVVKYKATGDFLTIELSATGAEYVSVGFSDDSEMGDDLTVTCTAKGDMYSIQTGYNVKHTAKVRFWNERHRMTSLTDKYIQKANGSRGRLWCQFTKPLIQDITTYGESEQVPGQLIQRRFDLKSRSHYVLIAHGDLYPGTETMSKHNERPVKTADPVNFLQPEFHQPYRIDKYEKAHGTIMLLAWLGLGSMGMIIAEYYKRFYTKKIGGVMLWFHLHRLFVISAYVLTIIGMLLIFAKLNWSWKSSYIVTSLHGGFGLAALGLATLQIIMGLLRPAGDAPRRPIFNIAHRIGGYTTISVAQTAYILAGLISILPYTYRIAHLAWTVVWMVYNVLFHIIFSVQGSRFDNKIKTTDETQEDSKDVKMKFQKTMLLLFVVYAIGQSLFYLVFMSLILAF